MPPTAVDSTLAVLQLVRVRLLTFSPTSGGTLASRLGTSPGAGIDGKLFIDQVPDGTTFPYGVLRLIQVRQDGDDGRFIRRAAVEIHISDRPRNAVIDGVARGTLLVKAAGDVCEAALRHWVASEAPHLRAMAGLTRDTVFYDGEPADREIVLERLVQPITYVPQFLI